MQFAAGKGLCGAVQGQVVQPDVDQELEPLTDLVDDFLSDGDQVAGEPESFEKAQRLFRGPGGNGRQVLVVDEHMACLGVEPVAVAGLADLRGQVLAEFLAYRTRCGFIEAPFHVGNDALENVPALVTAVLFAGVPELDFLVLAAVQDDVMDLIVERVPGRLDVKAVMLGERTDQVEVVRVSPVPAANRPTRQAELVADDHQFGVEEFLDAQPVAGGTCPRRVVEGKQPRLQFVQAVAAFRAGKFRGEHQSLFLRVVHGLDDGDVVGELQCRLEGFRQAKPHSRPDLEPVDDDLDRVLVSQAELGRCVQFIDLLVDARTDEALCTQLGQHLLMLPLAVLHHRGQQHQFLAVFQGQDLVHHLADRLRMQVDMVGRAARCAGTRKKQAKVVVDLGDGAHGRARVVCACLLFNRDRRRQAVDGIHVRFLQAREELACIGRQGLDIPALAFCENRVERQRGFPRAGQARDHDQLVPGKVQVNVLKVVRACAPDRNIFHLFNFAWAIKLVYVFRHPRCQARAFTNCCAWGAGVDAVRVFCPIIP